MATSSLSKTLGTATDTKIWTNSFWWKPAIGGSQQQIFNVTTGGADNTFFQVQYRDNAEIRLNANTLAWLITNRKFRDYSAWYHVVVVADSTQGTASNRLKLYINGTEETSFATDNRASISLNQTWGINLAQPHYIGSEGGSGSFVEGSMTHIHFIDGTAYDASTFGETDATTGIWKPKTAPSVTYGTNGFFLKGENSGALGTDSSGNSNTFTVGGTPTQTVDTPSNVFATMNPLATSSYSTLSQGNTVSTGNTSADNGNTYGTLSASSGKWFAECKAGGQVSTYPYIGIKQIIYHEFGRLLNSTAGIGGYSASTEFSVPSNGSLYSNNTFTSSWMASYTTSDIIGIAVDYDNGASYVSKNGVWQNSGDPTSGASKTGASATWTPSSQDGFVFYSGDYNGSSAKWNFGNGYFGTTAVASAGTNAGVGIFEYDVPTGYYALCTKNINTQEYS